MIFNFLGLLLAGNQWKMTIGISLYLMCNCRSIFNGFDLIEVVTILNGDFPMECATRYTYTIY